LNPNDEVYCLQSTEIGKKDIYIPIILNNTAPRTVSISRHDFDTGMDTVKDYSGKDIQRATEIGHAKEGVEYYYVRVRKPGAYKLNQIISKDGSDVRLYNRQVFVFTCPYARFKPVPAMDYCTGDNETLQLEVIGVPPLNVQYTRRTASGLVSNLKFDRVQPEEFKTPLQGQQTLDKSLFIASPEPDYTWAASQHLNINLNLTFESPSQEEYSISRVVDGAGNEIDLSGLSSQSFEVHGRPVVQFQCGQTDPVNLLIGSKSTQLPLGILGSGPFNLDYEFSGGPEVHSVKLTNNQNSISVSSPGEYKLLSVRDKFCQGQVMFPSTCQVVQPLVPTVKLQATPIASECAGDNEVGMKFVAEFAGAAPYVLEYVITKQTGRSKTVVERKKEIIDRSRHIFSYLPSSSGEYTYEFTTLDDRNYKKRPTQIAPIKQIVHPQPDAKFSARNGRAVKTCLGEDLTVDVDLRGSGPFVLYWTVGDQLYSDKVDGEKYTIKLPPFDRAGHHIASLVKIQDDNGCVKELEARDFTIDVRRDRPTAFFYTGQKMEHVVEITEGSTTHLPIRLTGEGPWTVTYRNVEMGDRSKIKRRFMDPNAQIEVKHTGHYELLNVEDSICKGDVLPYQFLIQYLDKPTIAIAEDQAVAVSEGTYERAAVCQGTSDSIDVVFSGLGPFYCTYKEYRDSNGILSSYQFLDNQEISTGVRRVRLPLRTAESGKYRYVFDKLSDQRYKEPFSVGGLQIEQLVHATPTVKFAFKSARKERNLCVGESLSSADMDPLYLEFSGVAPFKIEIAVRLESELQATIIKIDEIMTTRYKLQLPYKLEAAGSYVVKLLSVNDASGCGSQVEQNDDTMAKIKALDIATIKPVDTCDDLCVGDKIEYSLSGMGPFTVQYLFNGKTETVKSPTPKLSMLADKAGNVTIVSVGDQRNKCRSFPTGISKQIHEVPSSYISGGKEIIESIHEGMYMQSMI
jgi:nucleoporin POM152